MCIRDSSNLAQSGASLAVAVRSKDSNMKQLASAAGVSALMGITEPALYGVCLLYTSQTDKPGSEDGTAIP